MISEQRIILVTIIVVIVCTSLSAEARSESLSEVVFDSLEAGIFFGGGYSLGSGPPRQTGEVITLAESPIEVSNIDFALINFSGLVRSLDYKIHFYRLDGPLSYPGTELWSSALATITLPPRVPQVISLSVPDILVPRSFAWTIERLSSASGPGLPGVPSPTIGSVHGTVRFDTSGWLRFPKVPSQAFGLRVTGVHVLPEPTTLLLTSLAVCVLLQQRRRI